MIAAKKTYVGCGTDRPYNDSPAKLAARAKIVAWWHEFTGQKNIPSGRQFWTLCGPMTANGVLHKNCELLQMERAGLIEPAQFIGVEREQTTYQTNHHAVAARYGAFGPVLVLGDVGAVLREYQARGALAASVVHLDMPNMACPAIPLLARTLNFLNHVDGPTMVVWNVIAARVFPRRGAHPWDAGDTFYKGRRVLGYVREALMDDTLFLAAYRRGGWDQLPLGQPAYEGYEYPGVSTRSTIRMSMYAFVREGVGRAGAY